MIDTSMSQRRVMEAERAASYRFLEQVLREKKDQVFIMQFDLSPILRQDLTSSLPTLFERARARGYALHERSAQPDRRRHSALRRGGEGLQGDHEESIRPQGADFAHRWRGYGSEAGITEAIETAQRADTLLYSILFSDETYYGGFGGGDGRGVLMRMSRETGGGFFEVSKRQNLDQIYGVLQEELRSQYNIGYISRPAGKRLGIPQDTTNH